RSQLVMNIDDAPTILAAAGGAAGRIVDGTSLLPLWRDGGKELGRDLLVVNMPGPTHFDSIRTRNFMYAEHLNGDRELYDLRQDPYELQSQHANSTYDAAKASLAARLHSLVGCAGVSCRAGPAVRFVAGRHGRCGQVSARVTGPGVETVGFYAKGRRLAQDSRAPFRANLHFKSRLTIRARVTVAFDRLVTLHLPLPRLPYPPLL